MGSGTKKKPSYREVPAIAPAAPAEVEAGGELLLQTEVAQVVEAAEAGAYAHDPSGYEAFAADILHAASLLDQAAEPGSPLFGAATPAELASLKAALRAAARAHLSDHSPEELSAIALARGFVHPTVFSSSGENAPLAVWLHPLYSAETKAEIQAAATSRFEKAPDKAPILAAEHALAQSAGLASPAPEQPAFDLAGFQQALAEAEALLGRLPPGCTLPGTWSASHARDLFRLLDLEEQIHQAEVAGADPEEIASARKALAEEVARRLPPAWSATALYVELASARGLVHAETLETTQLVSWLRGATDPLEKEVIAEVAAERAERQEKAASTARALLHVLAHPPDALAEAYQAIASAHQAHAEAKKNLKWGPAQTRPEVLSKATDPEVAAAFEAWAKGRKLAELRQLASSRGLEHAGLATRRQLTNWLGASWRYGWKASLERGKIASRLAAKAAKAPATAPAPPAVPATPPSVPGPPGSFSAKVASIAAVLAHRQRAASQVPPPLPGAEFAKLRFSHDGSASALGGVHEKHFYLDQTGRRWLFKPDKASGGAAAAAEAATAEIWRRVGLPSPEVRLISLGGRRGSIQPLLAGAAPAPADPRALSEPEVRQLVAEHVASWALSDHDGHAQNFLRLPAGGLVRIDRGQAFRYFGTDRLDLSYHPNAAFGAPRPLYHRVYELAARDEVPLDPAWALPAIRAFEAIPEEEYRRLLRPVAEAGVKGGKAGWLPAMRARAARRLGTPSVPEAEVVEEFLRAACERKASLRTDFAAFFSKVLGKPASLAG